MRSGNSVHLRGRCVLPDALIPVGYLRQFPVMYEYARFRQVHRLTERSGIFVFLRQVDILPDEETYLHRMVTAPFRATLVVLGVFMVAKESTRRMSAGLRTWLVF